MWDLAKSNILHLSSSKIVPILVKGAFCKISTESHFNIEVGLKHSKVLGFNNITIFDIKLFSSLSPYFELKFRWRRTYLLPHKSMCKKGEFAFSYPTLFN